MRLIDADALLDDVIESKDQMINKWSTVQNNLLSRKANKILWIGTHWSIIDCISNRIEFLENAPEAMKGEDDA